MALIWSKKILFLVLKGVWKLLENFETWNLYYRLYFFLRNKYVNTRVPLYSYFFSIQAEVPNEMMTIFREKVEDFNRYWIYFRKVLFLGFKTLRLIFNVSDFYWNGCIMHKRVLPCLRNSSNLFLRTECNRSTSTRIVYLTFTKKPCCTKGKGVRLAILSDRLPVSVRSWHFRGKKASLFATTLYYASRRYIKTKNMLASSPVAIFILHLIVSCKISMSTWERCQ